MADIKAYKPRSSSVGSGQVLHCPYPFEKARLVAQEMADLLVLDLVDKRLVTDQVVLTVGYDIENLRDQGRRQQYRGKVRTDRYGRDVPVHAHGTANLDQYTSSTRRITKAVTELFDRIVDADLLVRRITMAATHVIPETEIPEKEQFEQLDLFTDYAARSRQRAREEEELDRERSVQEAMLAIKKKYGKNAVLKGMNLQEGATARDRNRQIGGHKA